MRIKGTQRILNSSFQFDAVLFGINYLGSAHTAAQFKTADAWPLGGGSSSRRAFIQYTLGRGVGMRKWVRDQRRSLVKTVARSAGAILIGVFGGAIQAEAISVGYTLEIAVNAANPNPAFVGNDPIFLLTNTSDADSIVSISFTVGDAATRNFDTAFNEIPHGVASASLVTPDTLQDAVRSDEVAYLFSGFDPADSFQWMSDVDTDCCGNTPEEFRTVFFNNGASPSSEVTVTFAGGKVLNLALPDTLPMQNSYLFAQSMVVPEPSSLTLLGFGLLAISAPARIRQRSKRHTERV